MGRKQPVAAKSNSSCIDIALDTLAKGKQALIFVNTKRGAEKLAEDIAHHHKPATLLSKLAEDALSVLSSPTKQCRCLAACLQKNIAFHHAGLHYKQREMVEDEFRKGNLKIICATPTLAAGVDLPAFRAIIRDLKRYGGRWGMDWIPTLEYLQMAGRAGRPSYDTVGEAIVIAASEAEKSLIEEKYVYGEPESIYSKLAVEPVLRTYVLSLVATEFVRNKEQLLSFFEKTFWAHQYEDMQELERIIDKMLFLLTSFGFIDEKTAFVSANTLENHQIKATLFGKRVAELYLDPVTAFHLMKGLKVAERLSKDKVSIDAIAFLHLISHTLEMRPLFRIKNKEMDAVNERYVALQEGLLEKEPSLYDSAYGDYMDAFKTAMVLEQWIDEKNEEYILETYDIRPGELQGKLDLADWLLYALEELARMQKMQHLLSEIKKLRLRVQNGVREELLSLLMLKNIGRVRARKLFANRIKNIEDVKKADYITLAQLLGKGVALDIKKQVGQDLSKVPVKENKRKGQISLLDY
ncbi:hypothetical protein HZB01_04525 [Candidatus Woesearchaeota archaeon]|nr:hypothetical protein [Candidatus Woesearchaeota archaeon]